MVHWHIKPGLLEVVVCTWFKHSRQFKRAKFDEIYFALKFVMPSFSKYDGWIVLHLFSKRTKPLIWSRSLQSCRHKIFMWQMHPGSWPGREYIISFSQANFWKVISGRRVLIINQVFGVLSRWMNKCKHYKCYSFNLFIWHIVIVGDILLNIYALPWTGVNLNSNTQIKHIWMI